MEHRASRLLALAALLWVILPIHAADLTRSTEETPQTTRQPRVKEGGKDDIDAIGNRDIGGRALGNWYSLEGEIRMEKALNELESGLRSTPRLFGNDKRFLG